MKIYEIGTGYTPIPAQMGAATEIVVEELVKAFQSQGADVTLVDIQCPDRPAHDLPLVEVPVPGMFAGTDVKLGIVHKLKRVVYSVALAGVLKNILKAAREPVLLHFHNQYNLFFFLKLVSPKLRAKAKIAYTVHSYIWPGEWEEIEATVHKRYFQEVVCVQNADYVLVLNEKTAEHFVRHLNVPAGRIHRIDNGVNTEVYRPLEEARNEAFKSSLGLSGKQLLFQAGSVCDRKNQLGAVELLKDYLQTHPQVVYVYAGGIIDGDYNERIRQFAAEHGLTAQIRYAGELAPGKTLNQYYSAAALTLFPSKIESFGLVILESVAAGTPVLLAGKPLFPLEQGCHIFDSPEEFLRITDAALAGQLRTPEARAQVDRDYSWAKVARDHTAIWQK